MTQWNTDQWLDGTPLETQQAMARLFITALMLGFILSIIATGKASNSFTLLLPWIAYATFSYLLLIIIMSSPEDSPARRLISLSADIAIISTLLHYAPQFMAPLYIVYLCIAIDYGFRYGEHYLITAMAVAVLAFVVVIATTPFWAELTSLSVGLLLGLVLLPLYNFAQLSRISRTKSKIDHFNQIRTEFMANMSHGLRIPVNTIVGLSHVMRSSESTGEGRKHLETLRMAATELEKEADQALNWFRLEAGSVALFKEPFDVYKVITDCVQILLPQAEAKGLPLRLSLDPGVPYYVEGDSHKLGQIVMNLIGNAIKFTQQGFVDVSLTLLERSVDKATLCFTVKDTGIGIPDARKRSILEPYCQAGAATEREYGGSGLGTAIARKTVEAMGGELWFQSVQYQGTIFWVKLAFNTLPEPNNHPLVQRLAVLAVAEDSRQDWLIPLQSWVGQLDRLKTDTFISQQMGYGYDLVFLEASSRIEPVLPCLRTHSVTELTPAYVMVTNDVCPLARKGNGIPAVQQRDRPSLYRALHARALWKQIHVNPMVNPVIPVARASRILLAEDNEPHQLITRWLLEQAGHQVVVVGNGMEALEALRAAAYDLAILDAQMPRMGGLEALRRYHEEAREAKVPVIITSADIAPESARRFQQAGAAHYLTKPLKPEMLLWVVSHTLEQTAPPDNGKTKRSQENATPSGCHTRLPSVLDNPYLNELKAHKKPLFMETLIASVRRTSDQALADLEHAIADQDQAACQRALHALANAAAAVGAETLCRLCHEATSAIDQELLSPDDGGWLAKIKKAHNALGTALANEASHR